jgi:hypothetical protein
MALRRLSSCLLVLALLASTLVACGAPAAQPDAAQQLSAIVGQTSMAFTANPGIWDAGELFRTLGAGRVISFGLHEVILPLAGAAKSQALLDGLQRSDATAAQGPAELMLRFLGASESTVVAGEDELGGVVNYFVGSDPAKWRAGVPTYQTLVYRDLYPGIDLSYRRGESSLKGTYTVAPGADPGLIRWQYDGAENVRLSQGELLIDAGSPLVEHAPQAWQTVSGGQQSVAVSYKLYADGSIGFQVGQYDAGLPLVIDPTLQYSTYVGTAACDGAYSTALDAADNIYLTGIADLHKTMGGVCGDQNSVDIFITKINPHEFEADQHVYTTYIGGDSYDQSLSIAVDLSGRAYVAGDTQSNDFPTTANAFQTASLGPTYNGDAVLVQLSPSGAVQYSTYLGGSAYEEGYSVSVTPGGLAAVTGFTTSSDFPVTADAYQSTQHATGSSNAFLSVLDAAQSGAASLRYSTYFGGSGGDEGYAVKMANGLIYLAGTSYSTDLPLKNAIQTVQRNPGNSYGDLFIASFDTMRSGSDQLRFCTLLGGTNMMEIPYGVTADGAGRIYVVGFTQSADFPVTAISPAFGGGWDAFVTKIDPVAPALVFSRYLGGDGYDGLRGVVVDRAGNVHVSGGTGSTNLPLVAPIQSTFGGGVASGTQLGWIGEGDGLIATLDPTGALLFSSYVGGTGADCFTGIALDSKGNVEAAGGTMSTDIATVHPYQASNSGGFDSLVVQIAGVAPAGPSFYNFGPIVVQRHH